MAKRKGKMVKFKCDKCDKISYRGRKSWYTEYDLTCNKCGEYASLNEVNAT